MDRVFRDHGRASVRAVDGVGRGAVGEETKRKVVFIAVVLGLLVAECAPPEKTPSGILGSAPEGVTVPEFNEMSDGESAVLLRCQLPKYAERVDKRGTTVFLGRHGRGHEAEAGARDAPSRAAHPRQGAYCLARWVFLGYLDHASKEVTEAIRCR